MGSSTGIPRAEGPEGWVSSSALSASFMPTAIAALDRHCLPKSGSWETGEGDRRRSHSQHSELWGLSSKQWPCLVLEEHRRHRQELAVP